MALARLFYAFSGCVVIISGRPEYLSKHEPANQRLLNFSIDFESSKYLASTINYTTVVNPKRSWGTWEGWGVSLCWWAHAFGKNELLADLVFSRKIREFQGQRLPGLGLNIARYNLGGSAWRPVDGDSMAASSNIPAFKQIPGFWQDWLSDDPSSSSWDWSVDANQVSMLQMAKARGASYFELFSNAPMWWMLKNHNPSGSTTGLTNNLQDWNFQNFTKYLAITAQHFKNVSGIEFSSVEPFNEPFSTYWYSQGSQEGCHFDHSLQAWIVGLLADELKQRGLDSLRIAASDEWKYDMALATWNSFSTDVKHLIGKVNTHGYQYTEGRRDLLYEAVRGKTLWNSEYGDGSASGLEMATNLNLDFQWLHPTAWCYWQIVDETDGWGMFKADMRSATPKLQTVNMKFFVLAHYSRHIRPGMTIVDSGDGNTVAAYSDGERRLVLVTTNYGNAQWITYDLKRFRVGGPVTRWCTNTGGGERYAEHHDLQAGRSMTVRFEANTVQTIEIEDAVVEDEAILL